jgi:hypothetical protein
LSSRPEPAVEGEEEGTRLRDIFLSYRRADTAGHAGRLTDALEASFGPGTVFRDVGSIDAGADFVHAIEKALAGARVVLVLIGNTWATETGPDGTPRLDDPRDFVRLEIATALAKGLPVVPVLVEGAQMPDARALPADLERLARLQAVELSEGRWAYDTARLVDTITRVAKLEPLGGSTRGGRRGSLYALAGVVLAAAIGGAWYALRPPPAPPPPPLEGVWKLPSGNTWTVWKDGAVYRVEETHVESKQVWKRGTGSVQGADGFIVDLDLVFDKDRVKYRYELRIAAEGKVLAGSVRDLVSGRQGQVTLVR